MQEGDSFTFYYPRLNTGGVQRSLVLFANELKHRGYEVSFILWERGGPEFNKLRQDIDIIVPDQISSLRGIPSLVRYLLNEQPDYLITRLESNNESIILACLAPGVSTTPVPGEGHVCTPLNSDARYADILTRRVAKTIYPRVDNFVVDTHGLKEHISELFGIQESKIGVCPPAVLERDFKPRIPPPPHKFFDATDPVIVSVGRLAPIKRHQLLIRAIAQLQNNLAPRLVIAGPGEERNALSDLATDLGIAHRVALPGFTDKPLHYMHHADVFALTSGSEAFGIVLVEALACGTPVVAADVPYGPREILEDGKYGVLTDETPEAVAAGLRKALNYNWDQEELRNRARKYNVKNITDIFINIISTG